METTITKIKNERGFEINHFIEFLKVEASKGATHLKFSVSSDPLWRFEWVETLKFEDAPETLMQKLTRLENELLKLRS